MIDNETEERHEEEPRRMSEQEARDYQGLTLNESGEKESGQDEETIRIHTIRLDELPWWKKAAGFIGIILFIAVCIAVAWFFLLGGAVLFVAGAVVYFLKKYVF